MRLTTNSSVRFDEFNAFCENPDNLKRIHPIPRLMERFTPRSKPILWTRFVALGQLCVSFATHEATEVGAALDPYDAPKLLSAAADDFIAANRDKDTQMLQGLGVNVNRRTQLSTVTKAG
jgi:hypothetical protein